MTELEKSFRRKELKQALLRKQAKKKEAWEIVNTYIDTSKVLTDCPVKQDFWCKHGLHKNKHFYRDIGCTMSIKVDQLDLCVKCGNISVYYGGNHNMGYLDPKKTVLCR
ncbi:MAG: hypothetical protein QM398_07230 [Thermoproteota archaeon]|nr:hypothetical protein [Thermoproteota archaeon]